MGPPTLSQFVIAILVWVIYFFVVAFACAKLYFKLRGQPPAPNQTVIVDGKSVSALARWEARDKRLQRVMIAIGLALGLIVPLILPWLVRAG
ncbi:MAG TPA: hypothetical protein VLY45_02930 [Nitrospiria bacterium]|nr:hypothetical protein [Nitrospiria bacterium]